VDIPGGLAVLLLVLAGLGYRVSERFLIGLNRRLALPAQVEEPGQANHGPCARQTSSRLQPSQTQRLRARGHRPDRDARGLPLAYEELPGNTADNATLRGFKKIEAQYGKAQRIWVMDRGIPMARWQVLFGGQVRGSAGRSHETYLESDPPGDAAAASDRTVPPCAPALVEAAVKRVLVDQIASAWHARRS